VRPGALSAASLRQTGGLPPPRNPGLLWPWVSFTALGRQPSGERSPPRPPDPSSSVWWSGSVCTAAGQGAYLPTAGAVGGLPEVWPGSIPEPEALCQCPGTAPPYPSRPGDSHYPEGSWEWPRHGRGLSHKTQIKPPGSHNYVAFTAVWSWGGHGLSLGFCFSFAKGVSRPLPTHSPLQVPIRAEQGASSGQEMGGGLSGLGSVLTHYWER